MSDFCPIFMQFFRQTEKNMQSSTILKAGVHGHFKNGRHRHPGMSVKCFQTGIDGSLCLTLAPSTLKQQILLSKNGKAICTHFYWPFTPKTPIIAMGGEGMD
jgi:hypothetical protein